MVTKQPVSFCFEGRQFCSSEKINGNKTIAFDALVIALFCSSEKINGNKTGVSFFKVNVEFCSSEKINGNKTAI